MNHPFSAFPAGCATLRSMLLSAVIATCASTLATHAAPVDDAAIIVTADRFQTPALGQPIAVQIITADEIRDSSATTVSEVLAKLGGVHTRINLLGVPDSPVDLRGFGISGDQNTLILINGQRLSENELVTARLSSIPLNAIERIEILRGAGAVMYGGGATGGTINIITQSPLGLPNGGSASATLGSHDLRDLRGSLRTGAEGWGLNLDVQHVEGDGYRQNNHYDQNVINGELRFGGKEDFIALHVGGDDQKARLPGARTEAEVASDPRGTSTPNDYAESSSQRFGMTAEKRFGAVTLGMDINQRSKDSRAFFDFGFGFSSLSDSNVDITSVSPRLLWTTTPGGMQNRFTAGLDWSDWDYTNITTSSFGNRDESGHQSNRAVYLRNELALTPRTRLTIGARRENVSQDQQEQVTPIPKQNNDQHLSATEFALQQDLGMGFSAYARLGRSFRIANIDENRCFFPPCAALLKPQRSSDRELGMQWREGQTSLRASVFEINLNDEIHFNALTFSNINLSPTRRRGFELEGKTMFVRQFDLAGHYAYTRARFREGVYGGVDVANNEVPLVPTQRFGATLGWQPAEATRVTFAANHVGNQRYDNDQANRFRDMPSYTVADIKVAHQIGRIRLAAGINNLFDKKFYSYGIVNGAFTSFNAYPEDRRNAYTSLEYRW
jgi:iron complex outermembrane receptor protein